MSDPDRPSTAKLDTDDLELLIGAIEGLSDKVDAIEKNAPVFSPDQAIRLSTAFAAKAENTAQQNLAPVLSQIETATAKLEKETNKATFHERQGRLSDTEKVIRDNHCGGSVLLPLSCSSSPQPGLGTGLSSEP